MLRLRDIMTTDVLAVDPETSIREAMELLALHHVSGAPVVSGDHLIGVVTATDLMAFASALSGVPTEREQSNDEAGIWGESTMEEDAEEEREAGSAYFSELWEDAGADVSARMETPEGPEWNALEEHDVSEVMTRAPLATLPPDADVSTAAELMRTQRIHRVLVTQGERLVGIVTSLDIANAAADQRLTRRTYVFNRSRDFDERPADADT